MPFYFNGPLPGEAQESASVQSQQSVSEARRSGQKNVEQKNSDNLFAQHFSAHKNKSQVQSHVPRSPAPSPGSHTCRAPPHPPRERPHRMTGTVAVISMPQITRPSMLPILLSFLPCGACHLHSTSCHLHSTFAVHVTCTPPALLLAVHVTCTVSSPALVCHLHLFLKWNTSGRDWSPVLRWNFSVPAGKLLGSKFGRATLHDGFSQLPNQTLIKCDVVQ